MSSAPLVAGPTALNEQSAIRRHSWERIDPSGWLRFLLVTLLGYALFGKGWAYLGLPPFFIGEFALGFGLLVTFFVGQWPATLRLLPVQLLGVLMLWGLARTVPYLGSYGADALRDAVIFGYGLFALVLCSYLIAAPGRLQALVRYFPFLANTFLIVAPLVFIASQFADGAIPRWPWAEVPVIHSKGGDVLVHLAGIVAFWASGIGTRPKTWQVILLIAFAAAVGIQNRGGMLSLMAVFAFCFCLKPRSELLKQMMLLGVAGIAVLALTDFNFRLPGKDRDLSFQQVIDNVASITGNSGKGNLSGTKQWRLQWWSKIYDYTVEGRYFWMGKGFGVNLADDDGFQGMAWEGKLRSPHNGHLTMLARAGVPGFTLWLLVQGSWAVSMFAAWRRSTLAGHERWSALFFFLLAYWLAFMANATFDVFIEGPMGGIWCWCLFGAGLAALILYSKQPQAFGSAAADRRTSPS